MPTTYTFVKRSGAPAGTIRFTLAGADLVIDDSSNTSIVTSNHDHAEYLAASPFLTLSGSTATPYVPQSIEDVFLRNGVLARDRTAPTTLPSSAFPRQLPRYSLEDDYGAPSSGSVQTALQAAVNDILAVKGGGQLVLQDRVYDFDSITWPSIGLDKPPAVIEFVGPYPTSTVGFMPGTGLTYLQGGDMPPPAKGAILKPTLASGSGFGNISAWSNILPVFRNVVVRCPSNPQWHGVDGGWLTNLSVAGLVIDTGRSWGDGSNPISAGAIQQPTNAGVHGIIFPGEGNGGVSRARDLLVAGFYTGLRHSEHFDGDRVTLAKNVVGYAPTDGWHASRVGRLSLYWNKYGVQPNNSNSSHPITPLVIDQLDTEEDPVGGNWYTTVYHINDPGNLLRGKASFRRMVPASGPSTILKRRGSAFFNVTPVATPPKASYDMVGFGGADTTGTIPASLNGESATELRGDWGVSSQRAYIATKSDSVLGDVIAWETGQTQVAVHTKIRLPATLTQTNLGLALCAVDASNYLCAVVASGATSIQKVDAGTFTNLSGNATGITMAGNQEMDLRVTITGKVVRLYLDGVLRSSYTLSAAEATKYFASGRHGFFAYTFGSTFEQGGANGGRWEFLRVESPGPMVS